MVVVLLDVTTRLLMAILLMMVSNGWLKNGWTMDIEDDVEDGYLG